MCDTRWWTEEKIEWYVRAASHSSFHSDMANILEQHLRKGEKLVEAGCGLGHVAAILQDHGWDITAFDSDKRVVEEAEKLHGKGIFHTADFHFASIPGDVLIALFFGRFTMEENLSRLLSQPCPRIIWVFSSHSGQEEGLCVRHAPSIEELGSAFDGRVRKWTAKEYELPFHQPLLSPDEAEAFIKQSYPGGDADKYMRHVLPSHDPAYPFIFRNNKKFTVCTMEK